MDQSLTCQKWEAKVSTRLEKARDHQIWPLFKDFFGLNQWYAGLSTCQGIHGTNGEPGCIRYCAGFRLRRDNINDESGESSTSWSKERLIAMDNEQMTFSYEIVDCNIGFKSYFSTIKVVPGGSGGGGCVIEWSFSVDPVAGWKFEDLVGKYEVRLELIAKKMEAYIISESEY